MPSSNQIFKYKYDLKSEEQDNCYQLENKVGGSIGSHQGPIRGVVLANNDYMMASYSFDSIKVW